MKTRPENCENMDELRTAIDALDTQLVGLLVERATLIDRAVEIKTRDNLPAHIQSRIDEVVGNVRDRASSQSLDPDLVERLWRELIAWSIAREDAAMK